MVFIIGNYARFNRPGGQRHDRGRAAAKFVDLLAGLTFNGRSPLNSTLANRRGLVFNLSF